MRSAGCAMNDFADRHIDGSVERTVARPLATGELQPLEAVALFIGLSLAAFALVWQLNQLTIWLSLPAVLLAGLYPFTKRFTYMPQAVLGVAFAMAVPMAFAATLNSVPLAAWWLFAAVVAWAIAYDTMYAMADRPDDLKIGVKSSAILFGRYDRLLVGLFQVLVWGLLTLSGALFGATPLYFMALMLLSLSLFGYQQWLIRQRERAACLRAFLNNHYYGLGVTLVIVADYSLGHRWLI